jgi:hypothetical protein
MINQECSITLSSIVLVAFLFDGYGSQLVMTQNPSPERPYSGSFETSYY